MASCRGRILAGIVLALAALVGVGSASFASHSSGYHWADNDPGYPRGYVYWVDQTGPAWPAYSAAIDWDSAARIDAVYTTSASSCPSHCSVVKEAPMGGGCDDWGVMEPSVNASGHLTSNTVTKVEAGCTTTLSYAKRRETICHEMGHSIGVGQRPSSAATCMRDGAPTGVQSPDQHDFDVIANLYNHND